jgi:putative Mg2+ transporter-C (MgtC) family protein
MIIQRRGTVRGLTTAATIWAMAAVGLASGFGRYGVALMTAAAVMLILVFMTLLKGKVLPESEDDPKPGKDHEAKSEADQPEDEKRDRPRG